MNNCLCNIFENEWVWLIIIALLLIFCCSGSCSGSYGNGDVLAMCNWDDDSALRAAVWTSGANYYCKSTFAKTAERVIFEQRFDGSTLFASVNGHYEGKKADIPTFSTKGRERNLSAIMPASPIFVESCTAMSLSNL